MAFPHLRKVCEKRGELLTFERWNRHEVSANVATVGSRDGGASTHLRKVCEKRGKPLTFGRWAGTKKEDFDLRKVGGDKEGGFRVWK